MMIDYKTTQAYQVVKSIVERIRAQHAEMAQAVVHDRQMPMA